MRRRILIRVLALLLGIIALSMIPSLLIALVDRETQSIRAFLYPLVVCTSGALLALGLGKSSNIAFNAGDGFLLVSLAWFLTSILGSIPFVITGVTSNPVDALFESVSGFTTTGATIFKDLEKLPRSILLWRAMTHWLGGMGIVVLTVALVPLLGVGGFQLLKAETPGPEKDKITPKITATAKILWFIYIGLTALEVLLLMMGGMNWFDAVTHAFATMATGGFGTKNISIAYYNSAWIDWVCTIFMILAGMNFSLYYRILQGKFQDLLKNTELKVYLSIVIITSVLVALVVLPQYGTLAGALRFSSFQVASIITTTGFATADFDLWPSFAKAVLFLLMFIGGCSGSTGGGIKVVRHVVLFKQAGNEIRRLLHPRGVFSIQLNGRVGRKDVVYGVAGFVFLYLTLVLLVTLVVSSAGADLISAFSSALVTIGNIGPGFGLIGPSQNYSNFPNYVKLVWSFAMIAGRLELWTVIILFTPEFWRR
ncbi:TrkH family potassium uptake protein [Gracilinema caldarium]|uniref:Potassium uptake protein, TrkH family n=1 Tax=Gracilinema caldarium (strain ATCC 51460 / DSM 7334 / H1) TaxID=744872 RepID=F8F4H3_GRAC1|nr:TrkH family potassium uptake protein [Gracilinema caldarium]AEJ20620.1 potassium uptake protein, TrkH family [Gracilinema caldarium DSM 7334]